MPVEPLPSPVIVEITRGLPAIGLIPLTSTLDVLKVNGVPTMPILYFNVPLTEAVPGVAGEKSVWTVHMPLSSEITTLSPALAVKPVSEKPLKLLSPISALQVEIVLKKHSTSFALDSPALINVAVERRRAAPVREWLIPGFNLKLTKGEFMVGREGGFVDATTLSQNRQSRKWALKNLSDAGQLHVKVSKITSIIHEKKSFQRCMTPRKASQVQQTASRAPLKEFTSNPLREHLRMPFSDAAGG